MKIFFVLFLAFALPIDLHNKDLREENKILKDRLRTFSSSSYSAFDDYTYNKAKLAAFLTNFNEDSDFMVKFALLEAIVYYLQCITENFEVFGEQDGVSIEDLKTATETLNKQLSSFQLFMFSKDLSNKYNDLKVKLDLKHEELLKEQQENSVLFAKIGKTQAEIQEFDLKLVKTEEKLKKLENELEDTKFVHSSHLEDLTNALQLEIIASIMKENDSFMEIQNSQDLLILKLQEQSEQQALTLEQISVENSGLEEKISLFLNNIARLERDLSAKSSELLKSENKFDDFRNTVETSTKTDIEKMRTVESVYLQDIEKSDADLGILELDLKTCENNVEIEQLNRRKVISKVNELEEELEENFMRVESAKKSRQKEVDFVEQRISDTSVEIHELKTQKADIEGKIGEQQQVIDNYKNELAEAEYQSKRRILD